MSSSSSTVLKRLHLTELRAEHIRNVSNRGASSLYVWPAPERQVVAWNHTSVLHPTRGSSPSMDWSILACSSIDEPIYGWRTPWMIHRWGARHPWTKGLFCACFRVVISQHKLPSMDKVILTKNSKDNPSFFHRHPTVKVKRCSKEEGLSFGPWMDVLLVYPSINGRVLACFWHVHPWIKVHFIGGSFMECVYR